MFKAVVSIVVAFSLFLPVSCVKTTDGKLVKSILDIAQVACILANDHLDDEHTLVKICNVDPGAVAEVVDLVKARKKASAMKAAAAAASASASVK